MGANLVEYQLVRIAKLLREPEDYNAWKLNQRSPALGDVGAVVDILHAPGLVDRYVVECSGPEGITIWLDDFDAEELETVSIAPGIQRETTGATATFTNL